MNPPTQCMLWAHPERIEERSLRELFEELKRVRYDDHHSRRVLRCRECGKLYFYEFYEEIDWAGGKDPQYLTYIPVETTEAAEKLMRRSTFEIAAYEGPSLRSDCPSTAKTPHVYWTHRDSGDPGPAAKRGGHDC